MKKTHENFKRMAGLSSSNCRDVVEKLRVKHNNGGDVRRKKESGGFSETVTTTDVPKGNISRVGIIKTTKIIGKPLTRVGRLETTASKFRDTSKLLKSGENKPKSLFSFKEGGKSKMKRCKHAIGGAGKIRKDQYDY